MKKLILYLVAILFLTGCNDPEPRKPVSVKSGRFSKTSAERNKDLLAAEEQLFEKIIKNDSLNTYQRSSNGYWYFYNIKADSTAYIPKENDLIKITYDLRSITNDTIYSSKEIGVVTVKVDKEALFPGLRTGIKLMREGETVTFLFPSSLAYGYHGDSKKIGVNVPLLSTVKLMEVLEQANDSLIN